MAQQFTLGATCKTLRQSAHPERQHDPHQAKDQRVCADDPCHRQCARRRVRDKHHAEQNRDNDADAQRPLVAYFPTPLYRGNHREDTPDDSPHRDEGEQRDGGDAGIDTGCRYRR